jgi:hypothetical protein
MNQARLLNKNDESSCDYSDNQIEGSAISTKRASSKMLTDQMLTANTSCQIPAPPRMDQSIFENITIICNQELTQNNQSVPIVKNRAYKQRKN